MVNRTFFALISAIALAIPSVAVAAPIDTEEVDTDYCIYDDSVANNGEVFSGLDASLVNVAITINGADPLGGSAIEEGTTYQISYDYILDIRPLLDSMGSLECFDLTGSYLNWRITNTAANLPGFTLSSDAVVDQSMVLSDFVFGGGLVSLTHGFTITAEELSDRLAQYYEGNFDFEVEVISTDLLPNQVVDGLLDFDASNP